jgi:metal-responsive CopG/Arc/MetJ family transcriptional regulator
MKVKTSITLSEKLLCEIDRAVGEGGNRSAFIEKAVDRYLYLQRKEARDAHDAEIYERHADYFNAEAEEILEAQIDLDELGDEVEALAER